MTNILPTQIQMYMDTVSVMCLLNQVFAPAFLDVLLILKLTCL